MFNNDNSSMLLEIQTLGGFDIGREKKSFFGQSPRSKKLLELFKYFVTFKGKKLLPESIIESLQPERDFKNPRNVLRTQIFRLRRILEEIAPGEKMEDYFNIAFSNGFYIFELGKNCVLDADEFEILIKDANKIREEDPGQAAKLYKKALKLYKGEYLSESLYNAWVIAIRNHYHRLYLQALFRLMEILKKKEDYGQLVDICEEAIIIEPYEEALHISFLEALLKLGQVNQAMSHYEYITSFLYNEFNAKPSPAMKNIYRRIQSYNDEKAETSLQTIELKLDDGLDDGAFLCDIDFFRFLYNTSKRNSLRTLTPDYLCLITLCAESLKKNYEHNKKKDVMKILKEVIAASLRKGDVFALWNDTQVVAILPDIKKGSIDVIEKRIKNNFYRIYGDSVPYELSFRFKPLKFQGA